MRAHQTSSLPARIDADTGVVKRAAALGLLLMGCGSSAADTGDEVRVGLLLPYTGKDGSAGANYERGVLMAAEQVNAAGGLHKRRLRIVYADTHSDVARGAQGAKSLVDQGVVAIIGPEDDELARELSATLGDADVALLTPSSSSVKSADALWFRLAPSAKDLGIALARLIENDGAKRIAVVSTSAVYEQSFATGARERLTGDGLAPQTSQVISARASNFSAAIDAIRGTQPDAIVLAADASTGSRFVNEYAFSARTTGIRWYLSPSLEHQAFVLNSLPDVVENMVGVAPDVNRNGTQSAEFNGAFVNRWNGVTPTTGAYFYYDALALYAIAYEAAAKEANSDPPPSEQVRSHLLSASGGSGLVVEWNELPKGLKQASEGKGVYYSGLTGVIKIGEKTGTRSNISTRYWTIRGGQIAPLEE
jgi:branched-chain amino acid transport system substrate-binding protein